MTDWVKTLYDDLIKEEVNGGWDQETYPAIIQYYDLKNTNKIHRMTERTLIEIDQGNIQVTQLGQNTAHLREAIDIIHVFLEIRRNPQNTVLEDKQLLKTVVDAFETWLKAKAYHDLRVIGMYPDREQLRMDIWLNGYDIT